MPGGPEHLYSLGSLSSKASVLAERHATLKQQLERVTQDLANVGHRVNLELPIAKLPLDLLSKIFIFLHSTQTLDSASLGQSPNISQTTRSEGRRCSELSFRTASTTRRVEFVVSHVCHHWRTLSLKIPALWRVFWCDKPQSCDALVVETNRLKTYLSRSAPAQDLDFYFDFTMTLCQPESAVAWYTYRYLASELLALTVSHSHRWRNLTIVANDSSRRVSLTSFQRAITCVAAPRLERLVVCVGLSYYHPGRVMKDGWEDQVLLLRDGDDEWACPQLKYLKLDVAGLKHCRPPNRSLTHLFLESGPSNAPPDDGVATTCIFKIDWTVFLSSEILRLPQLESLSLHEDVLSGASFPLLGRSIQHVHNDILTDFFIDLPGLKHLRIGFSFPGHSIPALTNNEGSFLLFLLRFITAPRLESLTVCGHLINSNPWKDSWASLIEPTLTSKSAVEIYAMRECFGSLKILTLSDVYIGVSDAIKAPFAHLVERTSTAQVVTISQSHPIHDAISSRSAVAVIQERPAWLKGLWPRAIDISMSLPPTSRSPPSHAHEDLERYIRLSKSAATHWDHLSVFRIPQAWFDVWFAQVEVEEELCEDPLGGDNCIWRESLSEGGGQGYGQEGQEATSEPTSTSTPVGLLARKLRDLQNLARTESGLRGRPLRIAPIQEAVSKVWPPDAGRIAFNTLSSEQFPPFEVHALIRQ